jgi:hypothetical protein
MGDFVQCLCTDLQLYAKNTNTGQKKRWAEGQKRGKKKNNERKTAANMVKGRKHILFLMAEIDKRGNKIPTIFKYTISNASCA